MGALAGVTEGVLMRQWRRAWNACQTVDAKLWAKLACMLVALLALLGLERRRRCLQRQHARLMLVLDFDKTITVNHTDGIQRRDLEQRERILGNVRDPQFLAQFCAQMVRRGHCIGIASYSDHRQGALQGKALVEEYLRAIFHPEDYVEFIPDAHIQCWNPDYAASPHASDEEGKNLHLRRLQAAADVQRADNMILVDDDQHNVNQANKEGFRAFWCGDAGFSLDYLESTPELLGLLFGDGVCMPCL